MQSASFSVPAPLNRLPTPLSPDQLRRLARLRDEADRKRARVAADAALSPNAKLQHRRTIDAAERDGIHALLTREQRRQIQQMRTEKARAHDEARARLRKSLTPEQRIRLKKLQAQGAPVDAIEAELSQTQRRDFSLLERNPKEFGKL